MKISTVPALDKAINSGLMAQCKEAGIDLCNSKETENRLSQTTYETGEMLWKIDNKPVMKLVIDNLTEDVIVFTLEKIKVKPNIITPKIITVN